VIDGVDPVSKYNDEFLEKNAGKVERSRKKHLRSIGERQSERTSRTKTVEIEPNISNEGPIRIRKDISLSNSGDSLDVPSYDYSTSIYYKNRNLRDGLGNFDGQLSDDIFYLKDNHDNYSQSKIDFIGIKPSTKVLHGKLKLRDNNNNTLSNFDLQKCFDYIDIMNRKKKEMYLDYKRIEALKKTENGQAVNPPSTTKKKLFEAFKKVR
jgi:hypothetical protein